MQPWQLLKPSQVLPTTFKTLSLPHCWSYDPYIFIAIKAINLMVCPKDLLDGYQCFRGGTKLNDDVYSISFLQSQTASNRTSRSTAWCWNSTRVSTDHWSSTAIRELHRAAAPPSFRGCAPLLLTSGFQPPRDSWSRAKLSHNSSNHPNIFGLWTHFTTAFCPLEVSGTISATEPTITEVEATTQSWMKGPRKSRLARVVPRQGMSHILQGNMLPWATFKGTIEFIRKSTVSLCSHKMHIYVWMHHVYK